MSRMVVGLEEGTYEPFFLSIHGFHVLRIAEQCGVRNPPNMQKLRNDFVFLYAAVHEACAQDVQEFYGAFTQSLLQQCSFPPCY